MLIRTWFLLMVVATSGVGCSTTESDFRQAAQINTIDSYQDFIKEHPEGKRSEEAKSLLDGLVTDADFKKAVEGNTIASYESFIERHPQSPLTKQARSSIQVIENAEQVQKEEAALFARISETDAREAYEGFIRDHPNSEFVARAKVGLKKLAAAKELVKITQSYNPPLRTFSISETSIFKDIFIRNLRRIGLSASQGEQSSDLTLSISGKEEWVKASGAFHFPSKGVCMSCTVKVQDSGAETVFEKKYSVGPLVPSGGVTIHYTRTEPEITIDPAIKSFLSHNAFVDIERVVDDNFLSDFRDALK